ncbi:MAG: trehalose-6-phosphate synthase [Deltaproteobacteria bacterium]|nr:trehalose-6-phosphate synthase [Deltaproteobacteria bacterium]
MSRALRFTVALVLGLGLLTWAASLIVSSTTRDWFMKDVRLRGQLAVNGARRALVAHWPDARAVQAILSEITRDERIMAAAACSAGLEQVAATVAYPDRFSCERIGVHVRPRSPRERWASWTSVDSLPGGQVHVSAIPIRDDGSAVGFVVLVQDMSYVGRREAKTQGFLVGAFAILAFSASVLTVLAARLSWRGWTRQMRDLLRGESPRPEFQPILRDVRDLVERLVAEREQEGQGGAWTPERLKQTLNRHLHGERIVVVANREPYIDELREGGEVVTLHPASGLVTALEPVMRACSGVWVAHGSGSADRQTADERGHVRVPPGEESYVVRRVWLSPEEERGYYYGFSNEGLWPLCHLAHTRPIFKSDDWRHYENVNRRFAETVCEEVDSDDPIVLVQDYHFALAPRLIRERLPRATILAFWHIPWPNSERLGICPWRTQLLDGLLGASIVGFHTQMHCNNFVDAVDRYLEARIDRELIGFVYQGRSTLLRAYPISIEWPDHWAESAPPAAECRKSVLADLGLGPEALLGVGVDRLDYTKGVEERFLAVERALELHPDLVGRFTFVQLAAPSRTLIDRYRELNERVEREAARINERFGKDGYRPIILKRVHHEPPAVFRYYRAADVCYVSSLHDGMNLVAKEFVSAREDERGVLVLSHFTGAARELTEALIVNPYDLDEAGEALAVALRMSEIEQRDRMRAMRRYLAEFNVYRWAGRMLGDAARLRRQDRLAIRLGIHAPTENGT